MPRARSNRCKRCGKVIFASHASAQHCADSIGREYGRRRMRAYFDPKCQHWHISRIKTLNEIRQKLGLLPRPSAGCTATRGTTPGLTSAPRSCGGADG